MAASRVDSCGAYTPSEPPLRQIRTDGGSFDLAVSEFAWRPVAFAEASPRAAPAAVGVVDMGLHPCMACRLGGNHKRLRVNP